MRQRRAVWRSVVACAAIGSGAGTASGQVCPEDINGDGVVDAVDLVSVLSAWGPCPGCLEDINGDDFVDRADLAMLLAAWGPECDPPAEGMVAHSVTIVDNAAGGAEPPFEPGVTHYTFDLQIATTIAGSHNAWTSTEIEAVLDDPGVSFYQHPVQFGSGAPPSPGLFSVFPALEFDSYYCEATVIAAGGAGGGSGAFPLEPYVEEDQHLAAMWFSTSPVQPELVKCTVARFTIVLPAEGLRPCMFTEGTSGGFRLGTLAGTTTQRTHGEQLFPFLFEIIGTACPEDLDRDCFVSIGDLLIVLGAWDTAAGDVTGDGMTDVADLLAVLGAWGPCE